LTKSDKKRATTSKQVKQDSKKR